MEVILTFLRSRTGALQILAFTTLRPMTVSYNKIYSLQAFQRQTVIYRLSRQSPLFLTAIFFNVKAAVKLKPTSYHGPRLRPRILCPKKSFQCEERFKTLFANLVVWVAFASLQIFLLLIIQFQYLIIRMSCKNDKKLITKKMVRMFLQSHSFRELNYATFKVAAILVLRE